MEEGCFRKVAGAFIVAAGCLHFVVDTLTVDSRVAKYTFKCQYYNLGRNLLQILWIYKLLIKSPILQGKLNFHQSHGKLGGAWEQG